MSDIQLKVYGLNSVLEFGKYKGQTIKQVLEQNVDYITWCLENINHFALDEEAELEWDSILDARSWDIERQLQGFDFNDLF